MKNTIDRVFIPRKRENVESKGVRYVCEPIHIVGVFVVVVAGEQDDWSCNPQNQRKKKKNRPTRYVR